MNTRRSTRRAATIDAIDDIPIKQRKTLRSNRNLISNSNPELNSNPATELPAMIENDNENEIENVAANSQHSNAAEDEDSTQPLFPASDPNDILAQADLLLAQIDAYALETSSRQNNSMEKCSSETENKPMTSTATENDETHGSTSTARNPNRKQSVENRSANNSLQSASTSNQSQYDDSVILIDDGAMPRPNRSDEDVIFVEEYVKPPPRITGVVDLCDEDEDDSVKKKNLMHVPSPVSTAQAARAGQFLTSPVASTSNGTVVKCPVCLDSVPNEEVHSTICGHLFCGPCIRNTIKSRKKCPMCNKGLTVKQIHRIYFHN